MEKTYKEILGEDNKILQKMFSHRINNLHHQYDYKDAIRIENIEDVKDTFSNCKDFVNAHIEIYSNHDEYDEYDDKNDLWMSLQELYTDFRLSIITKFYKQIKEENK